MVHKSPEHFMKAADFAFKRAKWVLLHR
jgi:hypothetical protein